VGDHARSRRQTDVHRIGMSAKIITCLKQRDLGLSF